MMEKKKIHIYLPVEIKTRELIPKVILSKIILENKKKIFVVILDPKLPY